MVGVSVCFAAHSQKDFFVHPFDREGVSETWDEYLNAKTIAGSQLSPAEKLATTKGISVNEAEFIIEDLRRDKVRYDATMQKGLQVDPGALTAQTNGKKQCADHLAALTPRIAKARRSTTSPTASTTCQSSSSTPTSSRLSSSSSIPVTDITEIDSSDEEI